jgi:hypothetical protein
VNPTSFGEKSDGKSWQFDFFGVLNVFSAILWFIMMCLVVTTTINLKKVIFFLLKPDFAAPKPSKTT